MKFRLLVVLTLTGCSAATANFKSPVMDSAWQPPEGQSCELGPVPPPVSVLADSSALVEEIGDMDDLSSGGYAVFSLNVDSTGVLQSVHLVEGSIPQNRGVEIEDAILERGRKQAEGADALLRVDIADRVQLTAGPSEECPPFLRNRRRVTEVLRERQSELAGINPLLVGSRYRAMVAAWVNTSGEVERAIIVRSSGQLSVDRAAIDVAPEWEFHPALLNRRPVPVWVQFPIDFQIHPGRQ